MRQHTLHLVSKPQFPAELTPALKGSLFNQPLPPNKVTFGSHCSFKHMLPGEPQCSSTIY